MLSLVIAVLMTGLSLAGIFFQNSLYPSEALRRSFVPNDVVNLLIGLPVLLGSLWLAGHGKLIGLLFWPGALFYCTYNYIAYAAAMPLTLPFALYLALTVLSVFALVRLLSGLDVIAIGERLRGKVPERLAGGVLVGFGALFFLRSAGQIFAAMAGQAALSAPEPGTLLADLLTCPVWVSGGVLLWRRQAFGYVSAAGLLFQASMLFIGLLAFFILQPFLSAAPFALVDFLVILAMGLVCFIPFGLFVRGILTQGSGR